MLKLSFDWADFANYLLNSFFMDRDENLERIRSRSQPWDIVVIGGGATGVGCALDAAARGLDVLLIEQEDLGSGTSSRSTKLIHGGVRYLRQGKISLVREALRERAFLLRNAPHVVHRLEFIVPCYGKFQKLFYGAGLKIYDRLAGRYSIGRSRILSRDETIKRMPTVKRSGLSGGIMYMDGQFDDTRLLIDMAVTASRLGACVINYARAAGLIVIDGRIAGVRLFDTVNAEAYEVTSRSVINATGAYCDPIRQMSDAGVKPVVTFARGSHIVLDREFLPTDAAMMIPRTSDGRVLFCIPWLGSVLVGTTDEPCETTELGQTVTEAEIDFLLETAGAYLTKQPTRDDIRSKFAGVRPLISHAATTNTAKLSRSHELFVDGNGLITITGGKWTTYRQMAEEAVNAAINIGRLAAGKCVTASLPIDVPPPRVGERLHPDLPYTTGDIERAFAVEMAQTAEDVLSRRTRIALLSEDAAASLELKVRELGAIEC